MKEIVLIDLSSIVHPIFAMSASDPDPNHCSLATVARVHALTNGNEHVAICCDSGKSFRKELEATYKANRPERNEPLHHQASLAIEALRADGFPVWTADGFEADDVIAAATMKALALDETTVLIVTGDKDLLQLVGPRVRAKAVQDGTIRDSGAVFEKFGVTPEQMRDYLTLVGDSSDNIKGIPGVGPKTAAALLAKHGSLDALYEDMADCGAAGIDIAPALATKLRAFKAQLPLTRALISLRTDLEIPFDELLKPRESEASKVFKAEAEAGFPNVIDAETNDTTDAPSEKPDVVTETQVEPTNGQPAPAESVMVKRETRDAEVVEPAPAEWERQLDPRSLRDAITLAKHMHDSRMFGTVIGNPQSALATIMAGREYGLPAMASLRAFHNIDGRQTMSADLIRGIVLRSGKAKYFRCTERTATRATFETKRDDDPIIALTFTIEEGRQAWPKTQEAWDKSGWGKNPADMCVARASAKLARLVYADVVQGLYAPEEFDV